MAELLARFRDIADRFPVPLAGFTEDFTFIIWNSECERVTGYSRQELLGRNDCLQRLYPDAGLLNGYIEEWNRHGRNLRDFRVKLKAKSGETRYIAWSSVALPRDFSDGAYVFAGVDQTARVVAERTLSRTQELARRLWKQVSDALILLDEKDRIAVVNPAGEKLLGEETVRLVGKRFHEVAPAHFVQRLASAIEAAKSQEVPSDLYLCWPEDGPTFRYSVRVVPLLHGDVGILFTDVAEVHRAEEERRRQEEHYRSLLRQHGLAFVRISPEERFLYLSQECAQLSGYTLDELMTMGPQKACELIFHSSDINGDHPLQRFRHEDSREPVEAEVRVLTKSGNLKWAMVRQVPVMDEAGKLLYYDFILWDLTERKLLEEQLHQAQKMEAVGTLAGGLAHDFNNLLTAVLGNLELTLRDLAPDDPSRGRLLAAENAAERAVAITRRLLAFTRRDAPKLQTLDLCASISETLEILRQSLPPNIRVETHQPKMPVYISADPVRLGQVLLNLCVNARDAMPRGGALTLECSEKSVSRSDIPSGVEATPGNYACITVADTGEGMTPEVLRRVFEPFFTTKEVGQGTGLGLSVAYGIVRSHGGWITAESTPGVGSTFRVYLPLASASELETRSPEDEGGLGGNECVLIVDDEDDVREVTKEMLHQSGYRTLQARDGVELFSVLSRHEGEVDVVLLDLVMPGLPAEDVAMRLQELYPELPVVATSGYHASEMDHSLGGVATGYLDKPYTRVQLTQAIRGALDKRE